MALLKDSKWKRKYTAHKQDLGDAFYLPALSCAHFYDRITGYFQARALTLASRGLEELVRGDGRMRLIVGCTLGPDEVTAIEKGEAIAAVVEKKLSLPLTTPTKLAHDALELLAWMVGKGYLQIKVGIPCDEKRRPIQWGILHDKVGVIEDKTGDALAFIGSVNETEAGWKDNRETIRVTTSWDDAEAVASDKQDFESLWNNEEPRTLIMDVPNAAKQRLLEFLPDDDGEPRRLRKPPPPSPKYTMPDVEQTALGVRDSAAAALVKPPLLPDERRRLVWGFVEHAALLPAGEAVGAATANVEPWPHQQRAFERMYRNWPAKLLIADEVGLGKTIQAGMLLRQSWLAGKAKRVLVLAPKAVLKQWQLELREKFNLDWPLYTGDSLSWLPTPSRRQGLDQEVSRKEWHREPFLLASSHLLRRRDRAPELIAEAAPWDLIVVDEAHHARSNSEGPNQLLRLLRALRPKTQSLILLTATPMQVAASEVWDLLDLLGLPPEWTPDAFIDYFERAAQPSPSAEDLARLARLFNSTEQAWGKVNPEEVRGRSANPIALFAIQKVLRRLREASVVGLNTLSTADRALAVHLLKTETPVRRLISRNTRDRLRQYRKEGKLKARIADRDVKDDEIGLLHEERRLYEEVEDYISSVYARASKQEKSAVGFVMTIYRRRLASSFWALRTTLQKRLDSARGNAVMVISEDDLDEEDGDEAPAPPQSEEVTRLEELLRELAKLGTDSKALHLSRVLKRLREKGLKQVMVFTQYTDTMDYLRGLLRDKHSVMCFSGRGGEVPISDGKWRTISRDETKKRFREGEAEILLCTDAAAEGLNFQFCGALVNYDMPWNPMRVEQRIGRIDRLGQSHDRVFVVNLHYKDTVETDVYLALRARIKLFENYVGKLQPILARLPGRIAEAALSGDRAAARAQAVADIDKDAASAGAAGFDLDEAADAGIADLPPAHAPCSLPDLDALVRAPALLPEGCIAKPLGNGEYEWMQPGQREKLRVTTNREFYDKNTESVELWSAGSSLFPRPAAVATEDEVRALKRARLRDVVDGY